MVKTDGGSNMVANTFVNNIPGWDEEEQFPIEDSVPHPPIASTSGVNQPSQEVEPMVEIEVSTTDDDNENIEDPLSMLLREMGISNAMMEAAIRDADENAAFEWCVIIPLTGSLTGQETDYVLYSKLRSDCVAHKLHSN